MRMIDVEAHFVLPTLLSTWANMGLPPTPELGFGDSPMARRLRDTDEGRVRDMDDQGITMQVLSVTTPGVQNLKATEAVAVAHDINDHLAGVVRSRPDRFGAFAALPTPDPERAAQELERAVGKLGFSGGVIFGRTGEANADDRSQDSIYAAAERLGVPLYLHPQQPVPAVQKAYYSGFDEGVEAVFATAGLGWYYDNGVQLLRLIFSGVFDRHPRLQIVVGHWGELVLFYLDHVQVMQDYGLKLQRPLMDYFRQNVWITGSGLLSEKYFHWAVEVVGTDRIINSTDYPYTYETGNALLDTSGGRARSFVENASISPQDKQAIASGNWERLVGSHQESSS